MECSCLQAQREGLGRRPLFLCAISRWAGGLDSVPCQDAQEERLERSQRARPALYLVRNRRAILRRTDRGGREARPAKRRVRGCSRDWNLNSAVPTSTAAHSPVAESIQRYIP